MSGFPTTAAIVFGGLALPIAAVLVHFNWKRMRIIKAAARATPEQLEAIYALVEACGSAPPNGYVLGRTQQFDPDETCRVWIPTALEDFPWSGRTVFVSEEPDVTFRFGESAGDKSVLLGRVYRPIAVPRSRLKSGKFRNTFAPDRTISQSAKLLAALAEVCPAYPKELLSYLLCAGGGNHEFEPIDQARIGSSPAWVQEDAWPTCDACSQRLSLIVHLPGSMLSRKSSSPSHYYFLGCKRHPEHTKSIDQLT